MSVTAVILFNYVTEVGAGHALSGSENLVYAVWNKELKHTLFNISLLCNNLPVLAGLDGFFFFFQLNSSTLQSYLTLSYL